MADTEQSDVAALTVQLLSAYLVNNEVAHADLAELIRTTRQALTGETAVSAEELASEIFKPAVSVRKSLASQDHILSLIDGKPYKTLKRHLSSHGLTPQTYRERYRLPADYPMVARGFAEQRRAIAAKIGLGRRAASAPKKDIAAVPAQTSSAGGGIASSAEPSASTTLASVSKAPSKAPARAKPGKAPARVKTIAKATPKVRQAKTTPAAAPAVAVSPPSKAVIKDAAPQVVSKLDGAISEASSEPPKAEPKTRQRSARGTLKLFSNAPADAALTPVVDEKSAGKAKAVKRKPSGTGKAAKPSVAKPTMKS